MLADWMHRLRSLVRRQAVDDDLNEEMRFHLEQQIDAYERQGLPPEDARRRARMEFGGFEQIREAHRDARGISLVDDFSRDLHYGIRQIRRSPAFAAAAILCLALGIGATTAIYSVVNTILLQPLPFRDADRLVRIIENAPPIAPGRPPRQPDIPNKELAEWRANATTLTDIAGVSGGWQWLVRTPRGSVGLWGGSASPSLFAMLGVSAHLGRTLVPDDTNVIVLSYDAWQRHFNLDPTIVGTTLEFRIGSLFGPDAAPRLMTVVGVLPLQFEFMGTADFYAPVGPNAGVTTIGQLAPNVSLEAAAQEINTIGASMRPPWPATAPPLAVPRFSTEGLKERAVEPLRPAFRILLAAVVVVLLIVCANVANLLLARGTTRHREITVRAAIGASRGRIFRQILTECLVLAMAGGGLGAIVAVGGITVVKQLAAVDAPGIFRLSFASNVLPRIQEVGVDWTVLGVAFLVSTATSILFGLLPALRLSAATIHTPALVSRSGGAERRESRTRAVLTVAQVTLATVLLVGAGLLAHSFVNLSRVNNGYDPAQVLAFNLLFPNQYSVARKAETIETLLTRFRRMPDVRAAGFSRHGILIGEELFIGTFVPQGRSLDEMRPLRNRVRSVSSGFLTTMGVPVLDGREFTDAETVSTPPVIVMNRAAAQQYFGSAPAVGQTVDWHFGKAQPQPVTVVGVVENIRQESPADEVFPEIFVEYRQFLTLLERWQAPQRQNELAIGFLGFALRTSSDPASRPGCSRVCCSG